MPPPIHFHDCGVGKHGQDHQWPLSGLPIADQATAMLSVEGTDGQLVRLPLEQRRERITADASSWLAAEHTYEQAKMGS